MTDVRQSNEFRGSVQAGAIAFGDGPATGNLYVGAASDQTTNERSKLLLVVVANVERDATIKAVTDLTGAAPTRAFIKHHTLYELGSIGRTDITLAQVAQGTVTADAAGASVPALIEAVNPDFIILVGICYGLKEGDPRCPQHPGDVLVASELRLVAHRKMADTEIERGGAVHPSPTLLDRFRTAQVDWNGRATVQFGQMVSESVLVNSTTYRRHIKERFPEAIGGEMEGAAVYAAAIRSKVDWGLVKAICDWGFGKTDEYQQLAANNAASFLAHMIRIGGLDPAVPKQH